MKLEEIVDCPPLVWLSATQAPALLLGWMRSELSGEWSAIVVYIRSSGERQKTSYRRMLVTSRGGAVRQLEGPEAYARVPRFLHTKSGEVVPLTGPAGAEQALPE